MSSTSTFSIRNDKQEQVIILIHGFSGACDQTFGLMPAFLAGNPSLKNWDIWCLGYPTSLQPDISGVWAADPPLANLAVSIGTFTQIHLQDYKRVAVVAHSMGGLIAQRAVVDGAFGDRLTHLLLFGTPSNGLKKAKFGRIFKRQVRDMIPGKGFIESLRVDWKKSFSTKMDFRLLTVAGLRDEFVPSSSSVDVFPKETRAFINGNHLEIVKPKKADDDSVLLIVRSLTGNLVTFSRYETMAKLEPRENELSCDELVDLALALELEGQTEKSLTLLEQRHKRDAADTEVAGVLAGRLKRRWFADPEGYESDGPRALLLYREAARQAIQKGDHHQAFYNAINEAFMTIALGPEEPDARVIEEAKGCAGVALHQVKLALVADEKRDRKWRLATQGEAQLHLGSIDAAIASYAAALEADADSRERQSMFQQAIWTSRLLNRDDWELRLKGLFGVHFMI